MSSPPSAKPTLLVVGGCGGLVGRSVLREFAEDRQILSLHRHRVPGEAAGVVRWVKGDAARIEDWSPYLDGIDQLLILAWYRAGPRGRFVRLGAGLERLVAQASRSGVRRLVHLSVPDAPPSLEEGLPYLYAKRAVDRAIEGGSVPYSIVRPTMLFGHGDRLLSVMLRLMHRYRRFPMFGDGSYHVSPLAVDDLARILRRELASDGRRNVTAGGPRRWVYHDLTDRMFSFLGLEARYFPLGPRNSVRLARAMETVGLSTIYAYEVEWLLSDRLGLPPYAGLEPPLRPVEPFLQEQVAKLQGHPVP